MNNNGSFSGIFESTVWRMPLAKRVALYLRVSTDEQTVANQRRELEAVAERNGWEVAATFQDRGISALSHEPLYGLDEVADRNRFSDVGVTAACANLLLITLHGEGGHRDDGNCHQVVVRSTSGSPSRKPWRSLRACRLTWGMTFVYVDLDREGRRFLCGGPTDTRIDSNLAAPSGLRWARLSS